MDRAFAFVATEHGLVPMAVAITQDAHDRIVSKLAAGQLAYTYSNICPHENRDACRCPKRTCFFENNKLYGTRDGTTALIVAKPTVRVVNPNTGKLRVLGKPARKPRQGKKGRGRR
jgi:hypothetical protein